ncbi:MAG: hypothetical protein AAGA75_02020 [Cyanobacteria bacterium P01_E01_bin.6]
MRLSRNIWCSGRSPCPTISGAIAPSHPCIAIRDSMFVLIAGGD